MIVVGDCREVMAGMEPESVDAIVTDPPYGLEFMGKEWDRLAHLSRNPNNAACLKAERTSGGEFGERIGVAYGTPRRIPRCRKCGKQKYNHPKSRCKCDSPEWDLEGYHHNYGMQQWHEVWAREAYRVLKPGGHLLAFGGSRTYHRMACAVEDAGFEIRDQIMWLYGAGFPKSHSVSKAFDRLAGHARGAEPDTRNGPNTNRASKGDKYSGGYRNGGPLDKGPISLLARQWDGWGTALKPAHEPIVVARKPLIGTVAANVERYGTGAINVDGCRIHTREEQYFKTDDTPRESLHNHAVYGFATYEKLVKRGGGHSSGRWPANVVLDEEAGRLLDQQSGTLKTGSMNGVYNNTLMANRPGERNGKPIQLKSVGSSGGASRFFQRVEWADDELRFMYCAKASRKERERGLEGCIERPSDVGDDRPSGSMSQRIHGRENRDRNTSVNHHPTVKPVALMRWLVRLVTPPGGLVLDPFAGSGTTGIACALEGFEFVGIEQDAEYAEIAEKRITAVEPDLFAEASASA